MKRINVVKKEKSELLEDMGFTCSENDSGDEIVYSFIVSDKLYKVLKNNALFYKKRLLL